VKGRNAVLAGLVLLSVITYLDRVCLGLAATEIRSELSISKEHWGWVIAAFSVSYGLLEIPSGAWGDRFGHRGVIARIVVWWSAFTALTGAVASFPALLVTRFLFGAGEAGAYPNIAGCLGRWFRPTERARAQGAIWAASRVGGAIAPVLVVELIRFVGWRGTFFAFGALGVVWAAGWYAWYREPARPPEGVTAYPQHGPMPWGALLRHRQVWRVVTAAFLYGWGSTFFLGWMPNYLEEGRGLTKDELQVYAALPFVFGAAGNLLGGFAGDVLTARYGPLVGRRLLGGVSLTASALLLLAGGAATDRYSCAILLALAYGAMDCMLPSAWANCLDIGGRFAGAVSGTMNSVVQAGGVISSVLFGYLAGLYGWDVPMYVIAVMVLLSGLTFATIDPTRPLVPAAAEGAP
jgi:ACS family glucarate transporter-like MFS transporter